MIQLEFIQKIDISERPFKGSKEAPVTIAVFSDYQCPYCARLEPVLQQVLNKYPKDIKIVLKHFPLPMHKFARKASAATLAAAKQGKFWQFHEETFKNLRTLNDAKVQKIAQELGLNLEQFNNDLKDPAIQKRINEDINNGRQAGVRGTPAIFVNGKLLKNRSLAGFQRLIELELKKTSTTSR
ncbi:DSBA oxidoreductase [Candidatus Thiomargarita nelsonii]|uniref:DSBA oxidoreductase n=1 Tax=Candidatus Thiomargarita nelsonii TaxID=1003181 RepID=A0A176RZL8_9GAMM|nr:DSBA oxidoreductase [Candidatus Thiomargarita nelsonii]